MMSLLVALLLQERPPFEATVRIERWTKSEDRIATSSARLRVRPGRALEWAEGSTRLVIGEGRAGFHPAELWLHDAAELRRRFHVTVEGEGALLPAAVTNADGSPRAPVAVALRGSTTACPAGALQGSASAEDERVVFRLVPRDEALRRKLSWIRAFAHPETLRIERALFHSSLQVTVMTLDGFREAGSADDPAFGFEGAGVRKEER